MGLPIATLNSKRGKVIALAKGAHKLAIGDVLVKNVVVVAQPTGGLFDVASKVGQVGGIESLQSGLKLIIDPGHFTLDWVVADGIKGIEARSGSVLDAGMGAVLSSVMTSIVTTVEKRDGKRPAVTEHMLLKLDEAIRTGSGFYVNGQLVDPMPHLNACRKLIINALDKLEAGANSISDIQAVILVGGGAHIYKRHVEERFSKHSIHMSLDPAYANARGFLTLAEMATKRGLVHRSNAV
jgi:plasmid segregation protein ParM